MARTGLTSENEVLLRAAELEEAGQHSQLSSEEVSSSLEGSSPHTGKNNRQFKTHVNELKNNPYETERRESDIHAFKATIKALETTNELLQATTDKLQAANEKSRQLNDELQSKNMSLSMEITKRKHVEQQLIKAKSDADAVNKAKTDFLTSMSHELRTPMNAVLGFAQMLQYDPKNPLTPTQNSHVESILTGGHHLLALINKVLDLAGIEANRLNVFLEDIDAGRIVEECVVMTSPLAQQRGIKIINSFGNGHSALLRTDLIRLKQVLLNLFGNAVKYNKDGGTITVHCQMTGNGFLRINVTDTGIGIPKDEHSSIFQMFHRVGAQPEISREGTGIGLSVTKKLVERLAGRIGFESEEGVGSTFWIELPLASNDEVLIWTKSLRIGVEAIDKDHLGLVALVNTLTDLSLAEKDVDEVVKQLISQTRYYFYREEMIMEVCGYRDLENHRALHRDFVKQMDRLVASWRKEYAPEFIQKLLLYVRNWLPDHIINVDANIADYAKGKDQMIRNLLEPLG